MAATFVLMLREGLEAALIVGIIGAYLVKVGRRDALRPVLAGVLAAVGLAVAAGVAIVATVGRLPLVVQESFEWSAGLAAVAVLTWMLFWMRRQGRAMKGELETDVAAALSSGSTTALVGLAFIAVIREGLETVLFLLAIGSSAGASASTVAGGLLGLVAAVGIGWAIFAAGVRIDLRRFFTVTGGILIFVSAGLMAFAVAEFGEAGLIRNTGRLFDLNGVLPASSPLGTVLAGLFGYRAAPTPLEALAWIAYLVPVLILFVGVPRRTALAVAAVSALATLSLGGCSPAAGGVPSGTTSAASAATGDGAGSGSGSGSRSATIEVTAAEYRFTPSRIATAPGAITFRITNAGADTHEFEIFRGETVVDEVEDIVPGITRELTVTLAEGEYTFACKLNGHDAIGMTGILAVSGT